MDKTIPLKNELLQKLLKNGLEKGIITSIYGPASSGKTTFCMLSSLSIIENNKKIIYIDTERGFSINRLSQISNNYKDFLKNILFLRPINFEEQEKSIEKILKVMNKEIKLIVLDTASFFYRVEIAKKKTEVKNLNNSLIRQISTLKEIATKHNIPIIITNQVYSSFENKNEVKIVGGSIINFASKCMIELNLEEVEVGKIRTARLKKHRSLPNNEVKFEIVEEGFKMDRRNI